MRHYQRKLRSCTRWAAAASLYAFVAALGAHAQSASSSAPDASASGDDDTIQLSPFTVNASSDSGYSATDTLAGTRVRTKLADVSSAINVVTAQFLQDTGATNNQSLLIYTPSTEVGGIYGNFSGVGGNATFDESANLLRPSQNTRVRGLDSADNTTDYFLTEIPWDSYNVGRVDIQRGPNSILFGVGSPAGIINASLNQASFKNSNKVENRVDNHGSVRGSVDFNYVLLKDELAVRVSALDDLTRYEQRPAFNHDHRVYGAVRFDPKLFANGHTTIEANAEDGDVNANRPRDLPPIDKLTPWFQPVGAAGSGVFGMGKLTANPNTTYNKYISNPNGSIFSNTFMGRMYATDVAMYYNGNTSAPTALNSLGFGTSIMEPFLNNVIVDAKGNVIQPSTGINGLVTGRYLGIPSTNQWATTAAAGLPGGAYYVDKTLSDPSIFNFYRNLLDGNNKREWQKWNAENFSLQQTFLDDRLGFEFAYNRQRYQDGQYALLGGQQYAISVDINSNLIDGSPNPNVGRPYVANSGQSGGGQSFVNRDNYRLTAFGELRASDFLGHTALASILGRHRFTLLAEQDEKTDQSRSFLQWATDPSFAQLTGQPNATLQTAARYVDWVAYLGNQNLLNATSAAGANLPRITGTISPAGYQTVRYFSTQWNAAGVNATAPYSYTTYDSSGNAVANTGTQKDNPANYVGWTTANVDVLNAANGDLAKLYTAGTENRYVVKSYGLTWQGYFLNNSLVPTIGWRQDTVNNNAATAAVDSQGVASMSFNHDPILTKSTTGHSISGGVVYHLTMLDKYLPYGTKVSVLYDNAENFKADAPRGDAFGNQIPNPTAKTVEYGIGVSTLNDRLTFRITHYDTTEDNANLTGATGGGFAGNFYLLWAVPYWSATEGLAALEGISAPTSSGGLGYAVPNMPSQYVQNNYYSWQTIATDKSGNPDGAAIFKAVSDFFQNFPLSQRFVDQYGLQMNVALMHSSNPADWFKAVPASTPTNQNLGAQPLYNGNLKDFGAPPSATVNTESKGWEFETTAQLTPNWDLTLNAVRTDARRIALDPTIGKLMQTMQQFLATDAGSIRWWGGPTFRDQWNNNLTANYNALVAQQGSQAAEVPKWRLNVVSTYHFSRGFFKNSYFGGALRWEDKRVLGYQYDPTLGTISVDKPWYGPTDTHVDLWVGHSFRLSNRIDWRVQLNVHNVAEKDRLVPVSVEPDGSVAVSRIQEGMGLQLTNTITF